ncbi:hypothetical protein CHARACLAT_011840 [Characodon lateralis]|uniref:Uncharacterized protein n=1 Tax=Characodon lateralis TaxID=208331 RepID=A0ABU7EIG0_9TELE|nr:hypothetical protein [Characodon lateralis]
MALQPDIQLVHGGAALLSRSRSSSDTAAQPPASPAPQSSILWSALRALSQHRAGGRTRTNSWRSSS